MLRTYHDLLATLARLSRTCACAADAQRIAAALLLACAPALVLAAVAGIAVVALCR